MRLAIAAAVLAVCSSALCATPAVLEKGLGDAHFATSTKNAEAQKFFDQGLAQMHSFWAREAER